ncbi:NUDIX hydrolase domain-like protein [Apiospora kogelbergensis]|uniref:NUDIX hydrolase domain-like protein n=1 Tax=Apiospora kogelbergensis TaxID=1337665 RepID=A0AAW0QEE2_9PEZI
MASTPYTKAAIGMPPPFTSDNSLAPFTVSMAAYLAANAGFEGLATGALVFYSSPPKDAITTNEFEGIEEDRILLVQRAPHDSMPLRWEVPGGACDDEDETVLHAMARELWEEAGLRAARIGPQVGESMVFFTRRGRRVLKVSFLTEVLLGEEKEGRPVVKLDPEEHVAFLWASEDECRRHRVDETEITFTHTSQEQTVLEGFRLRRELKRRAAS